jgi:hypothetical protein
LRGKTPEFFSSLTNELWNQDITSSLHCRFSGYLPCQLVMVAFMADVLIPEDMTVDLDFISQIVFLVIDLGVIGIMLRCKIRCQNPD